MTVRPDSRTVPGDDQRIIRAVGRLAIVVVIGAFTAQLGTALVNVGLDTITARLHGSLSAAQRVTSGYLLALAAAPPACGWLGRRIGPGTLWLGAPAAFTAASLARAGDQPDHAHRPASGAERGRGLLVPAGQTVLGRPAGPARTGRVVSSAVAGEPGQVGPPEQAGAGITGVDSRKEQRTASSCGRGPATGDLVAR